MVLILERETSEKDCRYEEEGTRGYLTKYLSSDIGEKMPSLASLKDKELQIFCALASGFTCQQAADEVLFLSPKTVQNYSAAIKEKLEARNIVEVVHRTIKELNLNAHPFLSNLWRIDATEELTDREHAVMLLTIQGNTALEIVPKLHIKEKTVYNFLNNCHSKLMVSNTITMIWRASALGLDKNAQKQPTGKTGGLFQY